MARRTTFLLASAALFTAAPALAQDDRYGTHADHGGAIEWEQREVVQDIGDAAPMMRHHGEHARHEMHRPAAPRFAYSDEEREAWLADCRIIMRGEDYYDRPDYDAEDRDNGGLIGGLLGAVVGGVAGNRIGGRGDRLAGTLIGAGVGGIAGAVIGDAIAGEDDDRRYRGEYEGDYPAEYCAAYLRRYEASGHAGQMAYMQVQPVMMMSAPAHHGGMREIVREEWVEEAAPTEHPRRHRRTVQRREPGKLTAVE